MNKLKKGCEKLLKGSDPSDPFSTESGRGGNTPLGADAHLHFEIKVDGIKLDPEKVFEWKHDK